MSVNIATPPVGVSTQPVSEYQPRSNQRARPVEGLAASNADREKLGDGAKPQNQALGPQQQAKAAPSDRPPGKDRSIPPQALFDASLISAAFKADLKLALEPKPDEERAPALSANPTTNVLGPDEANATSAKPNTGTVSADQPVTATPAVQTTQAATSATQIQDPTNQNNTAQDPSKFTLAQA